MRFRDDIDPAKTWVVSDTHFGHDNIVGFCHRPEDHEQVMIAEWRKEVPDDATVIHLGDLCYRGNAFFKNIVAPELTGERKLLIMGNHDKQRMAFYKQSGFKIVKPFKIALARSPVIGRGLIPVEEFSADSQGLPEWHVSFSHYAWNNAEDGAMNWDMDVRLHGHIHNNGYTRDRFVPFLRNHINLSVEQTKYKPVNLGLLLDAYLRGSFPATTEAQLADAAARKEAHNA